MNQEEFFKFIEETYAEAVSIVKKKNQDYAVGVDPFKNFRMSELVGISPDRAILVRVSDKLARVSNLLTPGKTAQVKDETIADTILDMINYLAILRAYLKAQQMPNPTQDRA